jgi:hypothetical protein
MPPESGGKSQYVGFRAPHQVVVKAKLAAKADNRSLSNYMLQLILEDLEEKENKLPRAAEESLEYKAPPKKDGNGEKVYPQMTQIFADNTDPPTPRLRRTRKKVRSRRQFEN